MERDTQLRELFQFREHLETKRWVSADNRLDSMRIRRFELFNTLDTSIDKLTHSNDANVLNLFHLQRTFIPCFGTQASLQH